MIFDNKPISEITDQDLINLIGDQEEDLQIDFKQLDYEKDSKKPEKHKYEICKDVAAMANAAGGYILIGVNENNRIAQEFFNIENAAGVAQRINDICLQYIKPRIPGLEVREYHLTQENKDLVIIHIPTNEMRPHGFTLNNTITNIFVKRYNDTIRDYPTDEMLEDYSQRSPTKPEELIINRIDELETKLIPIIRSFQRERMDSITPEDNALDVENYNELVRIMNLRFDEVISDEPYYRIFTLPKVLNPDAVSTEDQHIREILYDPPNRRRPAGFGVTGLYDQEVSQTREGINGRNLTGGEIILLKNGYFEVRCPIYNQFQRGWGSPQFAIPNSIKWLYPYVVIEFPVSFLRLVKDIYNESGIKSDIFIQQDYHNIIRYALPKGAPTHPTFGVFLHEESVYEKSDPIHFEKWVSNDFIPDHEAYGLVKHVYADFGISDIRAIPAFDENGYFILE
ncbi:MAG: ATP-binding protein [Candidatus Poribacteria bacterium]|nr:ATP-binding protein [Candidatus Poribacteria bacterium]